MEPRYIVCWLSIYFEISFSSLLQVALIDHVVLFPLRCPSRSDRAGVRPLNSQQAPLCLLSFFRFFLGILVTNLSTGWRESSSIL